MIKYIEIKNIEIAHALVGEIKNNIMRDHEPVIFDSARLLATTLTETEQDLMNCLVRAHKELKAAKKIIDRAGSTLYHDPSYEDN